MHLIGDQVVQVVQLQGALVRHQRVGVSERTPTGDDMAVRMGREASQPIDARPDTLKRSRLAGWYPSVERGTPAATAWRAAR